MTSEQLYEQAQNIVSQAETRYEHQRATNGGTITPEMETVWYEALKRADELYTEAAFKFEMECRDIDHQDELQMQSELRNGG